MTEAVATKKLTEYADCAGCASKLPAADLAAVMSDLAPVDDERVIVDYRTADDAGVYRWPGGPALVQTVDFFTPIVDDPYTFGQIAAANSLSDVYAMGGMPRTALAIAALPSKDGPTPEMVRAMFRGGSDMLKQAGVVLLGGHTVTDPEVKFGYSVTGAVDPEHVWTNSGARVGDVLVLTKPLGTGIIVRATKFGRTTDDRLAAAVDTMLRLNVTPVQVASHLSAGVVHACTDITGFGLAGHASEMAAASGVTLVVEAASLPVLPGALKLAAKNLPCGGRANERHFKSLSFDQSVSYDQFLLALDPQTSGGLLLSIDAAAVTPFLDAMEAHGERAYVIGRVEPGEPAAPLVRIVA